MSVYTRTDLARESYREIKEDLNGVEERSVQVGPFSVFRMNIERESAAERLGKPVGRYITVECGSLQLMSQEDRLQLENLLADELKELTQLLIGKLPDPACSIFVTGLGNAELTADALGPDTVSKLTVTGHLKKHEPVLYEKLGCSALTALAPGVLGQTGIETVELLQAAVRSIKPDVVVVIDALAARSCSRLASTVQISDAGIIPGSGVGNHRSAITAQTLGVPVIAMGIPMVVDSATLVYDALHEAEVEQISDRLHTVLETGRSFLVSPKESDVIADYCSDLLSKALELAFVGDLML